MKISPFRNLVTELPIEALDVTILPRTARFDEQQTVLDPSTKYYPNLAETGCNAIYVVILYTHE